MRILLWSGISLVVCSALVFAPASLAQGSDQAAVNARASLKFATSSDAPECFTTAVERGDPDKGAATFVAQLAPGCHEPWHWNTANVAVLMVSGTFRVEMKGAANPVVLRAGDYAWVPARGTHQARCVSAAACVMFFDVDAVLEAHFVDSSGNDISFSDAVKLAAKPLTKPAVKPPVKPVVKPEPGPR